MQDLISRMKISLKLPSTVLYYIISSTALLLNSIEIYVLAQIKHRKAYEKFLVSLSVSDICVSLSQISILSLYYIWDENEYVMGLTTSSYFFFLVISFLHLFWICLDRLWAVVQPIQHNIFVTGRKVISLIAGTWVTVCGAGVICFTVFEINDPNQAPREEIVAYRDKIYLAAGITIILADFIYLVAYGLIVFTVKNKSSIASTKSSNRTRVVVLCIAMALSFVISSFPYALFQLRAIPKNGEWVSILVLLNTVSNPMIYLLQTYSCKRSKESRGQAHDAVEMKNRVKCISTEVLV